MQTIGTCSICNGAVQVPELWGSTIPPVPTCAKCGATRSTPHGQVIDMTPSKPRDVSRNGDVVFRSYAGYVAD